MHERDPAIDDAGVGEPSPDADRELLGLCLGRHRAFGTWDSYREGNLLHIHVPGTLPPFTSEVPAALVEYMIAEDVQTLFCWGPNSLGLRDAWPDFVPAGVRWEDRWNRLIRIRFDDYRPDRSERHWRRARAFAQRGFRLEADALDARASCLDLLQPLISRIPPGLQRDIYNSFTALAASPQTLILSVVADGDVVGFMGIRTLAPGYGYTCWSAVDHAFPNLTDFLYAETIAFLARRLVILDLGYGATEGIFAYKAKWRPTAIMKPRFYLRFDRRVGCSYSPATRGPENSESGNSLYDRRSGRACIFRVLASREYSNCGCSVIFC